MSWWDGNCPKLQRCVTHAKCPQWLILTIRWWYCAVLYGQRSPFLFSAPLLFVSCWLASLSYTLSASQKNAHFNTLITTPHCAYIMPTHAHTAAERITLTCTRACVTGRHPEIFFIQSQNEDQKCQTLLYCFLTVRITFSGSSRPLW